MHQPAHESIGKSAAEFIILSDSFANKKVMLLTFENKKNNPTANTFKQRLAQDSIQITKEIILKKGEDVLAALSKVKNNDVDVIFAPSTNTSIGTNLVSWMIMREINIPVIGNVTWMDSREYNIQKANEFTTYFYDSDFLFAENDSTESFNVKYLEQCKIPASDAASKGYELGHFIAQKLI